MRGLARVALGNTDEGLSVIRQGIEMDSTKHGMGFATNFAIYAEALNIAGLTEKALSTLDEAMPLMKRCGERLWEANAYSLKGDLLLAQSGEQQTAAEACYGHAIDIAGSQSAKSWELRAATRLARLWHSQGRTPEARDLLAPVYG